MSLGRIEEGLVVALRRGYEISMNHSVVNPTSDLLGHRQLVSLPVLTE